MSAKTEQQSMLTQLYERQGKVIREAREARGWSQQELAEAAETNQQTIDRIERGVTGKSKALPRVLSALDIRGAVSTAIEDAVESIRKEVVSSMMGAGLPENASLSEIIDIWRSHHEDRLPVYAIAQHGEFVLITSFPAMYPVEVVNGAFGFMTHASDMEPAFRRGDIAVVNPHLPLQADNDVLMVRKTTDPNKRNVFLRTLEKVESGQYHVRQWNPLDKSTLSDEEYAALMVVSKISKSR